MSDKKKNIEELFKSGLEKDNPVFKEEYWIQFEKTLNNPQHPSSSSGKNGKSKGSGFFLNRLIIALISGIALIATIIIFNSSNKEKTSIISPNQKDNVSINNGNKQESSKIDTIISHHESLETKRTENYNKFDTSKIQKEKAVLSFTNKSKRVNDNQYSAPEEKNIIETNILVNNTTEELKPNRTNGKNSNIPEIIVESNSQPSNNKENEFIEAGKDNISNEKFEPNLTNDSIYSDKKSDKGHKSLLSMKDSKEVSKDVKAVNEEDREISEKNQRKNEDSLIVGKELDTLNIDNLEAENKQLEKDNVQAKGLTLSIIPGISMYRQINNTNRYETGIGVSPTFGMSIHYALNEKFLLSLGAGFLSTRGHHLIYKTTKVSYLIYERKEITSIENREISFIEVPLTMHYQLRNHSLGLGPQFKFLWNAHGNKLYSLITPYNATFDSEAVSGYTEGLQKLTFGLGVEYTYNISERFAASLKYNYMFGDFTKNTIYPDSKMDYINTINLSLKFKIFNILK